MLGCKLAELIGEREALDLVNEFIAQLIFAGCSLLLVKQGFQYSSDTYIYVPMYLI